jgi:hypothetical protein
MKNFEMMFVAAAILLTANSPMASAKETTDEKISAVAHDAKRGVKKAAHRVEEALCAKGDVTCAGKKVENRVIEAKDATVDKATEVKNKIN